MPSLWIHSNTKGGTSQSLQAMGVCAALTPFVPQGRATNFIQLYFIQLYKVNGVKWQLGDSSDQVCVG